MLSNGSATSETSAACSGVVPPTAKLAQIHFTNANATYFFVLGNSEDNVTLSGTAGIIVIGTSASVYALMPLDASQAMTYMMGGAGGGAYADLYGYFFDR